MNFLQLPTISEMTHRERNFQLKVEELLSDISNPEYRQIVVEVFVSYFDSARLSSVTCGYGMPTVVTRTFL